MIHWAAGLPRQTEFIRTVRMYAKAWDRYLQVIQNEISENGVRYQQEMLAAQGRLFALLPPHFSSSPPRLITLLNSLQADPLTDVVNVRGQVYVVTSHLRTGSCLHELIHVLLAPWLHKREERISTRATLLDLVYDRMIYLAYAWDHSAASWMNVFSETLVRVLAVLVSDDNVPGQLSEIDDLVHHGFAYALPIAETMSTMGKEQSLSDEWLEQCLRACARVAKQVRGN